MAIIKKSIVSVYQLPENLAALALADSNETAARIAGDLVEKTRIESVDTALRADLVIEAATARAAELVLRTNLATEASRALASETTLQAHIDTEEAARIAGDLALGVRIDNVLSNVDGVALNSLTEIVTAFQAADGTLNGAITSLASSASTDLVAEIARAEAAEVVLTTNLATEATTARAAELVLRNDLSAEVVARTAADVALDAALKAFATEAVRLGGALPEMEMLTVTASKIVLAHAPKNGVKGIMNFGRVSYVVMNNVENLADVVVDSSDISGKTFIVSTDIAGEWDTKSVKVQYWFIAAA